MRCLYCGKELALLKRWRGGGEFCSDAHRQQYRQEYDQLALSRLLQATPPANLDVGSAQEPEDTALSTIPDLTPPATNLRPLMQPPVHAPVAKAQPQKPPDPQPVVTAPQPVKSARTLPPEPPPAAPPAKERPAQVITKPAPVGPPSAQEEPAPPAFARYQAELPVPQAGTNEMRSIPLALVEFSAPVLPARTIASGEAAPGELASAGRIVLGSARAADQLSAPRGRGVEVREFARLMPVLETAPKSVGLTSIDAPLAPLPMVMGARAAGNAVLWIAPERESPEPAIELGELARLDLTAEKSVVTSPSPEMALEAAAEPPPVQAPSPVKESVPEAASGAHPDAFAGMQWIPLTVEGILPGHGRPVQVFSTPIFSASPVRIPRTGAMPLRPLIVLGPPPGPLAAAVPAKSKTVAAEDSKSNTPAPATSVTASSSQVRAQQPAAPAAQAKAPAARRANGAAKSAGAKPASSKQNGPKPAAPEPVEQVVAAAAAAVPDKIEPPPAAPPPNIDLGLPSLQLHTQEYFWTRLPAAAKLGLAAGVVLAVSGLVYLATDGGKATANTASNKPAPVTQTAPLTDMVWLTDWAPETDAKRGRRVSVLRGSMPLADYRVEFQAQIESKAMGWVYRAKDPKNYYVNRVEIVKAGLEPKIALVRFAVLDGQEQPRTQLPLNIPVRLDTLYKIRFEALKDRFSTWIGDQKIDEWGDTHLRSGGVGMYSEKGESISMKGSVSVIPLVAKE